MKTIFLSLSIFTSFFIGYFFSVYQNEVLFLWSEQTINICNKSTTDIKDIVINKELSFHNIKINTCTEYKTTHNLYKRALIEIYTREDEKIIQYHSIPIDLVGTKKIWSEKHTLVINAVTKWEKMIPQYYNAIDYDIEKTQKNNEQGF